MWRRITFGAPSRPTSPTTTMAGRIRELKVFRSVAPAYRGSHALRQRMPRSRSWHAQFSAAFTTTTHWPRSSGFREAPETGPLRVRSDLVVPPMPDSTLAGPRGSPHRSAVGPQESGREISVPPSATADAQQSPRMDFSRSTGVRPCNLHTPNPKSDQTARVQLRAIIYRFGSAREVDQLQGLEASPRAL
jgi:hypothetical protein